jgi:tetratricopeptide (TPR) repeat protein
LAQLELYEQRIAARAHAFELLGCPLECGRTEVRTAWVNLSRVFHPDALPARGLSHLRDRVSRVFAALSEANMILSNNAEREKLRQEIQRGHHGADIPDATAMAHAALQSELIAREADRLLRANKFERARARYEEATKLTPDEPDLHAAIVWCDYNLSGKSLADQTLAIKKLGEVVDSNQRLARAHYFRGLVLKDANDVNGAIVSFTLAHEYDKRLIDAERQARALRARRGPTTRQPSTTERARRGLMGLFGKK